MEALSIVGVLLRLRWSVLAGAVFALGIGVVLSGKAGGPFSSPGRLMYSVTAEAQVDESKPLVADSTVNGRPAQTQTILAADYLTSEAVREEIASMAGVPGTSLTVATPSIDVPMRQSPLVTAAQVTVAPATPYTVTPLAWQNAPLITLVASGPDARVVSRLASGAMRALVRGPTGAPRASGTPLVVTQVGEARRGAWRTGGPRLKLATAAAVFLFGVWCFVLVLLSGIRRVGRAAGTRDAPTAAA
jgi:hypothetical protein